MIKQLTRKDLMKPLPARPGESSYKEPRANVVTASLLASSPLNPYDTVHPNGHINYFEDAPAAIMNSRREPNFVALESMNPRGRPDEEFDQHMRIPTPKPPRCRPSPLNRSHSLVDGHKPSEIRISSDGLPNSEDLALGWQTQEHKNGFRAIEEGHGSREFANHKVALPAAPNSGAPRSARMSQSPRTPRTLRRKRYSGALLTANCPHISYESFPAYESYSPRKFSITSMVSVGSTMVCRGTESKQVDKTKPMSGFLPLNRLAKMTDVEAQGQREKPGVGERMRKVKILILGKKAK
ncbi:hypothetical protein K469DRAFT_698018 [Zopfia rhizophila CBS 207.26]|uniref:Pal1-domain-containing protein n=1 Tax=Zopfia rhizophila CBS 207.26 TaxID=1314779 RepID=A0A6A6EJ91_9PEZI|nr:hypothetical protein K469DRAFT_698018 [Zopfia rhizophila CBS 207.26]